MSEGIELEDISARNFSSQNAVEDSHHGGRLNLDANQEQAVALWAYAATTL